MSRFNSECTEMAIAYLTCAVWADSPDTELGKSRTVDDIGGASQERALIVCREFLRLHGQDLDDTGDGPEQWGHDLWLTRNGHGCGFWSRDYADDLGERLTVASKRLGEVYLDVSDTGFVTITDDGTGS